MHAVDYHAYAVLTMNKLLCLVLSAHAVAAASCSGPTNPAGPTEIRLNITDATTETVDTTRFTRLEASENSMLYGIDQMIAIDSFIIIRSRNYLRSFNKNSGAFISDVARQGNTHSQFSDISRLWNSGDTILIFDSNEKSIGKYLPDGQFLGKSHPFASTCIPENQPPRQIYRMPSGETISINGSTGGSTRLNPLASLYSKDLDYIGAVPGREIKESTYLTNGVFYDEKNSRLLHWEPLRDTIYSINTQNIEALYAINWGENALPPSIKELPTLIERAEGFTTANAPLYASFIQHVQIYDNNLYFSFSDNRKQSYIAHINLIDGSTKISSFKSTDGRYTQGSFFKINGNEAYIGLIDNINIESNPIIYTIPKSQLE